MGGYPPGVRLRLEREAKLVELVEPLDGAPGRRLEASGVLAKDDGFCVIFDNRPDIVRLGPDLVTGAPENRVVTQKRREATGYEDIAYDPDSDRFFALIEALPVRSGAYQAKVVQFDGSLRYLRSDWLDFPLADANKGMEGLTCLRSNGRTCLLVARLDHTLDQHATTHCDECRCETTPQPGVDRSWADSSTSTRRAA